MKVTLTSFISPLIRQNLLDDNGRMSKGWVQWLLPFTQRVQFNAVDTSTSPGVFTLGPAKKNQNVEVIVKKVTADGNHVTIAASTGDTLDEVAVLTTNVGATAKCRYVSDGVSTWHLI